MFLIYSFVCSWKSCYKGNIFCPFVQFISITCRFTSAKCFYEPSRLPQILKTIKPARSGATRLLPFIAGITNHCRRIRRWGNRRDRKSRSSFFLADCLVVACCCVAYFG